MKIAVDTEYDEVTKVPFIVTMADDSVSKLLYPDKKKDYWMIKQICESSDYTKIFHSATSDIYALSRIGISVQPHYEDTFIMSSIIDENFSSRKLKELAKKYLKEPCLEAKELNKIKNKCKKECKKKGIEFRWSLIPKETIEPYAVKDAEYTYALHNYFESKIKPYQKLYEMELELVPIVVDMQKRGHKIDRSFCEVESEKLEQIYEFYYNKLVRFYGKLFNIGSPKDLRLLIKKAGLFINEKTPTGLVSTGKEVLEKFADKSPIVQWIINARSCDKQVGTYYWPLLNEYTSPSDNTAHFSFYQSGTKSGRFSAELIQTIPNKQDKTEVKNNVRKAFIPRKGYTNYYFDYDQQEMKLFVHFTENMSLVKSIKNGIDPYIATAIDIFGQEEYDKDPEDTRRIVKNICLGMIYGMGSNSLAARLNLPLNQAYSILSRYDQKYRVKSFLSKMASLLNRQGYVSIDWIGRDYRVPKHLSYKCVNIIIQGSAAYIIKLAMIRIKAYTAAYPGINMLIQAHDELIVEIPNKYDHSIIVPKIKELMEDHTTFLVPITASVKYSEVSWLDKKPRKVAA